MRDEKEKFRKFPVFQPSRIRVQFSIMKCMSQRDSRAATLSKAAQDQSEDKPQRVALMLTQGQGVLKECLKHGWIQSIQEQTTVPLQRLEVVNTLQHVPEKIVQTIVEPCSQTLKMFLLPQFEATPL